MSERLTDRGGRAILQAVRGQDESWQSKITSNHTLQSVYVSEPRGSSISQGVSLELQSITKLDPHQTLQAKAWAYIDGSIDDLSAIKLGTKLGPNLLEFVSTRGGVDSLFDLLRSRENDPGSFTDQPTHEKVRLERDLKSVELQNEILRAMIKSERQHRSKRQASERTEMSWSTDQSQSVSVNDLEEGEQRQRKAMARCLLLPFFKASEVCCRLFMDMTKESPPRS